MYVYMFVTTVGLLPNKAKGGTKLIFGKHSMCATTCVPIIYSEYYSPVAYFVKFIYSEKATKFCEIFP